MPRVTQMGLTVAIPVADMPDTRAQATAYVQGLAEQAQESLKRAAGGIAPAGPVAVNLSNAQDDPLLGRIYALTLAAPFDADALPVDCEFYAAYNGGAGGVHQPDQGPLVRDNTPGGS